MKLMIKQFLSQSIYISLGVFLAVLGLEGFLIPNHFMDGGVTGVSMLLSIKSGLPLSYVILLVNLPFVVIGFYKVNWRFAFKGCIAIVSLAIALELIPILFPQLTKITNDFLLAAVFGGVFLGAGIGFTLRGGAVLDGTEIVAILIKRKFSVSIGDVILIFNSLIFTFGAIFIGIEPVMYSILTYFSASKTIDFLVYGLEEFIGIYIISVKSEEIRTSILNEMGRGATILKGERGFSKDDQDVLYCVITRFEVPKLKESVFNIDESAFITMHKISDTVGGHIKKRAIH
ncbi:hypothetical protein DID75_05040 [Candidatus Marinamargulisbacteria bacterium SCGC AG-410-N11]|nr:hypothetical protein DID75_05040 [Candidatus Marinamargulisbacteria bacterium SCGC AG-410-N11]